MSIVDLLYKRWEIAFFKTHPSYSAESLQIGEHDVWVYVAAQPQLNYAVTAMEQGKLYYLKLFWGVAQPHVFTLRDTKNVKKGIEYLIKANKIVETYGKDIDAFIIWYMNRMFPL